jgi:hypothetical protein
MRRDPGILTPDYTTVLETISKLAFVCGLALSAVLESNTALGGAALGMPYAPAKGFSLQKIDEEKFDHHAVEEGLKECGPDWLGRYLSTSNEPAGLELNLSRCWRTAKFLGVRAKDLADVVLTHEAAHFVSHIGIGRYMHTPWENFSEASRADKEYIAQVACWGVFTVFERSDLMKAMRTLARYQSDVYNSWKKFENRCAQFLDNPLQIIAMLTLEVANVPGRQAHPEIEDTHENSGYEE